jgi:hypothetical protein
MGNDINGLVDSMMEELMRQATRAKSLHPEQSSNPHYVLGYIESIAQWYVVKAYELGREHRHDFDFPPVPSSIPPQELEGIERYASPYEEMA